jgi:hypothetical protein
VVGRLLCGRAGLGRARREGLGRAAESFHVARCRFGPAGAAVRAALGRERARARLARRGAQLRLANTERAERLRRGGRPRGERLLQPGGARDRSRQCAVERACERRQALEQDRIAAALPPQVRDRRKRGRRSL